MTKTEKLIARCKELGINPESLTNNPQREEAIAAAEKAAEDKAAADKAAADKVAAEKADAEKAAADKVAADKAAADKAASEKAAKKAAAEKAAAEKAAAENAAYEDERGRKWKFKSTAPKTINIDGHPMSQEDILASEDVISELVYGNSSFLTQIHE